MWFVIINDKKKWRDKSILFLASSTDLVDIIGEV